MKKIKEWLSDDWGDIFIGVLLIAICISLCYLVFKLVLSALGMLIAFIIEHSMWLLSAGAGASGMHAYHVYKRDTQDLQIRQRVDPVVTKTENQTKENH